MSVWIGMTGGMDKHWGEKELPRVGHQLASCSLLISYVLMFLKDFKGYIRLKRLRTPGPSQTIAQLQVNINTYIQYK